VRTGSSRFVVHRFGDGSRPAGRCSCHQGNRFHPGAHSAAWPARQLNAAGRCRSPTAEDPRRRPRVSVAAVIGALPNAAVANESGGDRSGEPTLLSSVGAVLPPFCSTSMGAAFTFPARPVWRLTVLGTCRAASRRVDRRAVHQCPHDRCGGGWPTGSSRTDSAVRRGHLQAATDGSPDSSRRGVRHSSIDRSTRSRRTGRADLRRPPATRPGELTGPRCCRTGNRRRAERDRSQRGIQRLARRPRAFRPIPTRDRGDPSGGR
jgi:hypothetical protein